MLRDEKNSYRSSRHPVPFKRSESSENVNYSNLQMCLVKYSVTQKFANLNNSRLGKPRRAANPTQTIREILKNLTVDLYTRDGTYADHDVSSSFTRIRETPEIEAATLAHMYVYTIKYIARHYIQNVYLVCYIYKYMYINISGERRGVHTGKEGNPHKVAFGTIAIPRARASPAPKEHA